MGCDLAGRRFGRLTAIRYVKGYSTPRGSRDGWLCRCDCGNEIVVATSSLTHGRTRSCGCIRREATSKNHARTLGHYKGTAVTKIRPDRAANRDNKLGIKGVYWCEGKQKYRSMIYFKGKSIHLGYFDTLDKAVKAREDAEEEYYKPIIEEYEAKQENHTNEKSN